MPKGFNDKNHRMVSFSELIAPEEEKKWGENE